MLVNEEIIDEIYYSAGEERYKRGLTYAEEKRVTIKKVIYDDKNNFELYATVKGKDEKSYQTYFRLAKGEIDDLECDCKDYEAHYGICKHVIATILEFINNPVYEKTYKSTGMIPVKKDKKVELKDTNRSFKQIINAFYKDEMDSLNEVTLSSLEENAIKVKIVPNLILDIYSKQLKVEFKIGMTQLYKLKDLTMFYERMLKKEKHRYGSKLEFIHDKEAFEETSIPLLDFIIKHAEVIKFVNNPANDGYKYYGKTLSDNSIILSNSGLDELFEIVKGKKIAYQDDNLKQGNITFIPSEPNIMFTMESINEEQAVIKPNIEVLTYTLVDGKEYSYILIDDMFYRVSKKFRDNTFRLLEIFRKNFEKEIIFYKKELPDFFSLVMPKVRDNIVINEKDKLELESYIPKNLHVKIFLDYNKSGYIIADIKFCYGSIEFSPLEELKDVKIARNIVRETKALDVLRKTGFMLEKGKNRFILVKDDLIYKFLSEDIENYMNQFEVLITDNFKKKQINKPKITGIGVKIQNDLLNIDLSGLEFDKQELKEILEKYKFKKKYHRLKDGSFLTLEENPDIEFLNSLEEGLGIDYKELSKEIIQVPIYRSMYLNNILDNIKNIEVKKDEEFKTIVNTMSDMGLDEHIKIPDAMEGTLRYYQRIGFSWLKTIDQYNLGGILADDMGLGKTIQMISVLLSYIQDTKKEDRNPSIVICPSSLTLNWENEVNKFTNKVKTIVISGNLNERKKKISKIPQYDLVITSYDLLKRDLEIYEEKNYSFRYAIADEAQYIKNSNTLNAKALKNVNAKTRYALTGTPIENSLSELWSIFDYIMPGYLFSYHKFKDLYELPIVRDNDERAMKKLKKLINPFILRRVKKEVLTELPEKSITILNNQMEDEQEKIYLSYLTSAKEQVENEISANGFEKSQIKILSLLMRLRQICCHPGLFIEDYKAESSKLNQCVEIIKDAVVSEHKILVFSSYTSMFGIIEEELKTENIKYFKLTGKTKVDERVAMVDKFNGDPNIKVFLISLKAGGTGLNLTGADMVIHYDPWWNSSAENQATDRAYRIGQKNNVQVYKLITKDSIEEKIYELQEKKSKLIDNMLSTEVSFINKLTKEEIMQLFE